MKRNLAFFLIMTSAALAQTPTPGKPAAKPSAATVKAVPQSATKTSASPVNVSVAPSAKAATVSVQPAPAKSAAATPAKPATVSAQSPKASATNAKATRSNAAGVKPAPAPAKVAVGVAKGAQVPQKKVADVKVPGKEMPKTATVKVPGKVEAKTSTVAVKDGKPADGDKKQAPKAIHAVGRRDPFVSPVVKLGSVGSGCSSGKRCLAIDQIALKGIVKSDVGMIAVVVNAMNKAYFLRENDPVFNGYVVKITGDAIVFKESFHDRLGKPLTRDVTKTISRPVA